MKSIIYFLLGVLGVVALVFFTNDSWRAGSAQPGLSVTIATTSSIQLGPQLNKTIAATSTNCSTRIVSSGASALVLSFTDAFGPNNLSGAFGHTQAASTTVAYDAALYGCGALTGYAYSSSTIMYAEAR